MLASFLLPDVPGLRLDALTTNDQIICLMMTATQPTATCPLCTVPSERIHSRYQRTVKDLPWAGHVVRVHLAVRRFFCDNPTCRRKIFVERLGPVIRVFARRTERLTTQLQCDNPTCRRKIFVERLGPVIRVFARRTERLTTQLQQLAFAFASESGARRVAALGMPASASTLLRLQRQMSLADRPPPRIIGVDDWAFRKGKNYGTLIVDLEQRRPIDLLPDIKAETLAAWLRDQPQIEVVSRDRAGNFADGATLGAPQAVQVADRWHLFRNLGEAVQRVLERHPTALRAAAQAQVDPPASAAPSVASEPSDRQGLEQPSASSADVEAPSVREQRFQEVMALHGQGYSIRAIAQTVQLNWRTVKRYVVSHELPKRGAPAIQHTSSVLPYRSYLERRWQEGCQNKTLLWEEIQAQGYRGSLSSVYRALKHLHYDAPSHTRAATSGRQRYALSPRQGMWLLVRSVDELTTRERAGREALEQASPDITTATRLAERFQAMVRQRDMTALEGWLEDARTSGVAAFKHFALSLRRDEPAVRAALELVWSNGQLEAQVNRLKVIKRIGYGRASFDLLRRRVLYTT